MKIDSFKPYQPMIEAIVALFHPLVEAAVHDLRSGKIVMLYNNISKRKVGDRTPLQELSVKTDDFPDFFPPYAKENWDGRMLKCTSITIRDQSRSPVGLICFNFDTSIFEHFQTQLGTFLKVKDQSNNPVELFSEDWKSQITDSIQKYLQTERLSLEHLSRTEKKKLVRHLYDKGIFNFKNAPTFIAQSLRVSRASIYNYLDERPL